MKWPHPKPITPGHSCVTTRKAAKMTNHNDPEFGFDKTAALSDPGPERDFPVPTPMYGSKAPSSPVETTAGSVRPIPPEGAERPAGEAEGSYEVIAGWLCESGQGCTCGSGGASPHEQDCGYTPLGKVDDLLAEYGLRQVERKTLRATIAERDATIERLWAQLNEATNVPDARVTSALLIEATGSELPEYKHPIQTAFADERPKYEPKP